jgi:ABC-type transport system involved in Fe-S cluster assembly fused permease/ATPase subunit
VFERSGRTRRGGSPDQVFRHVHDLSLRFHLERRTGSLTKIVERGTKSIDMMLYFLLFNIAPTVIELPRSASSSSSSSAPGWSPRRWRSSPSTSLHRKVTDWRTAAPARDERGRQQGDRPRGRFSLLNYETVKYFGAEEREAKRYDEAIGAYAAPRCERGRSPGSTSASR